MRYDEEHCREAFDRLLKNSGVRADWTDGDEPPDYYAAWGGRTFAVEVTSIHGHTLLAGRNRSWTGISHELFSFAAEVFREVQATVEIPGTFLVSVPSFPNLAAWKPEIVASLTRCFKNDARTAARMEPVVSARPEGRELVVWKLSDEGSGLIEQVIPTGAFISRREDELTGLLQASVGTKAQKLSLIAMPLILVILDRYGFQRSLEEWEARLPAERSTFSAIVRVQGDIAEYVWESFGS